MRDIVWIHGEWMGKLVSRICRWYRVTNLIQYTEPVSFITQIYRFSFQYFPCNTEVFLVQIYIPYNRVLILVNTETTYSLTAWRPLQWRNAAPSMSHCSSRSDLALLRGEVFAVFRHVFAVSGAVVVAVLPLLAGYIILVIITVITGTSAVYRLCHS